jgi:hypothetical protein
MSVWQNLNKPRNKREERVAKIARDVERERIIKLLEEKYIELDCDHDGAWWCHAEDEISKLITLIKGEK